MRRSCATAVPTRHFTTVNGDRNDWDALTVHSVPEDVSRSFESAGFTPERSHICVASRLEPEGKFGECWLAVGEAQVGIVGRNGGTPELVWSSPLETIRGATTQPVTGGGMLVLDVDGTPREVVRYDAAQAGLFGGIGHGLNREIKRRTEPETSGSLARDLALLLEKEREHYCPTCQRRLPRNTRVCRFCLKRGSTLGRILSFAGPYKGRLALMALMMVSGTALHLVPPQIMRVLVDDVLVSREHAGRLPLLVALLALVMIADHGIGILRARLGIWVGCHITNSIQQRAFQHLQALSLSYFNKQQTGALMSRINNDARQMQGFLVEGIQYTVVNLLTILGVAAVLIWMNPLLGSLVLLPVPFVVLLSVWVWRKIGRRFRLLWMSISSVASYLNDALSGIRVIKAFGREEEEIGKFERRVNRSRDRMISAEQTWQTLVPVMNLMIQSALLLIWYFGAYEVYGERLTIGGLLAYVSYLGMIFGPLQLLTRLNDWLSRSLTAAARVFEILDVEADIDTRPDARAMPKVRGDLEVRNVTFGYERHVPVLKGVSFTVGAGEMIGLVGRSGAGKSTIINLIGRMYDPDEGAVLLDGVDLRDIRVEDLRQHVGFVLQDTFLFNGSVAENIAYARTGATRDEIIRAADAACAHDFIMNLPDGYDTYVGERGARLSGGERQRIAIARALLHDPRILILDEATSSMDTETESKIQSALSHLVKGRTTIAIAHRLSTLRHASRLVVIDDGRVAEQGTHAELMEKEGGVYRGLVEIQTEWNRIIGVGG